MTTGFVWGLILAYEVGMSFKHKWDYDRRVAEAGSPVGVYRFGSFLPGSMRMIAFLSLFMAVLTVWKGFGAVTDFLAVGFLELSFELCLYFVLLAIIMPLLRRYINAEACALMWVLPLFSLWFGCIDRSVLPRLVINIPERAFDIFKYIWMAGAAGIVIWNILRHMAFKNAILKDARPLSDSRAMQVWEKERIYLQRPLNVHVLTSPHVTTPLTIGFAGGGAKLLLPDREYTPQELRLIFRHELRHMENGDIGNKVFLMLCRAFCWVNPLIRPAVSRASDDFELACDEAVLAGADEGQRQLYARLILSSAGDGQGFTSCLSISANSLKYRLKSITEPRKKRSGAMLLALTILFTATWGGFTAVSLRYGTLEELELSKYDKVELDSYYHLWDTSVTQVTPVDEEAVKECLRGISVSAVKAFSLPEQGEGAIARLSTEKGIVEISIKDEWLMVRRGDSRRVYRINGDIALPRFW